MTNEELERLRVRAMEDAVIASIPKELRDMMAEAQRKHEAKGGCPGCGHMVLACHYSPCSVADNDLY